MKPENSTDAHPAAAGPAKPGKAPLRAGDIAVCRGPRGYNFTMGREYEILAYEEPYRDESSSSGFVWPAYVRGKDDEGRVVHCHAHRFTPK